LISIQHGTSPCLTVWSAIKVLVQANPRMFDWYPVCQCQDSTAQDANAKIQPHKMPIDTCGWHTGHHCYPVCQLPSRFRIFSRSARTKVASCVPTAVYKSFSIAHFSQNALAHRIPNCSAQDSKVVSGSGSGPI
jgi:hypothetical protein